MRVLAIDLVDVLSQFVTWRSIDFLDFLESTTLNECSLKFKVGWENLCELGANIFQDVRWSQLRRIRGDEYLLEGEAQEQEDGYTSG